MAANTQFGPLHYVPVCKLKQGECLALAELHQHYSPDWDYLTPLLEVGNPNPQKTKSRKIGGKTERTPIPVNQQFRDAIVRNVPSLPKGHAFFVDLQLIDTSVRTPEGEHPFDFASKKFTEQGLKFIPVVSLGADDVYVAKMSDFADKGAKEVAVRIGEKNFTPNVHNDIDDLLRTLRVKASSVHLIVDYATMPENDDAMHLRVRGMLTLIPHVQEWRTLTLVLSSFPDMAKIVPDMSSAHTEDRNDWNLWDSLRQNATGIPRMPSFGDYHADEPRWSELAVVTPGDTFRYTTERHYVIAKGGSLQKTRGALTRLMYKITAGRPTFSSIFSWADKRISDIVTSHPEKPVGNGMMFRKVGTNRHLTVVVRQLASLAGAAVPSTPPGPMIAPDQVITE